MFDGLLKSKFYTKCKSDIKLTRSRIEVIQKKRNAMQKYLRNDVSDLLKNGLGMNAYNRVEGLLIEMNKSECYELIDRCCELISNHLISMNKQRDCPVECQESASSLMFAAARIADLPELRELRDVFTEKYGKSLDSFVNKELVEKLKHGIPSREKKLQLLQEIAAETGLVWNSKSLDAKLFEERANNKDLGKETNDGNFKAKNESLAPKDVVKSQNAHVMKPIERHDRSSSPAKKIRPDKEEERGEKHRGYKYGLIAPPYSKSIGAEKTKIDDHIGEKEARSAPKSVRRRHLKPIGEISDEDKEKEANNNKAQAAQARKILKFLDKGNNDNLDEEERVMDRLLRHYSRKNGTIHSRVKSEVGLKLLHEKKEPCSKTGPKEEARGKEFGPTRVLSLPGESMGPNENSKRHFRASSLQPEILGENNNNHVHPKLPDCDDFEATLAELRRK